MSTRKLILTALACGMAILIAGSAQLLRLSNSDSNAATVFKAGQSATVGDVVVTLLGADSSAGRASVRMESTSADLLPQFPIDLWTQQVASTVSPASAADSSCDDITVVDKGVIQECRLIFPAAEAATTYVRFSRDGAVATWVVES